MKTYFPMGLLLFAACFPLSIPAEEPVPLGERAFRVIRGTESPDKRFALGVGRTTERAEKGKPRLLADDSAWNAGLADTGEESIGNYIVDLHEDVILAETGMGYVGSGPSYNRSECAAYWSPDSRTVIQAIKFQGRYGEAQLLRIDAEGRRVSKPFDLAAAANEQARTFLKKRGNRAWNALSNSEEFAIQPIFPLLTNETVGLTVWGQIVHSHKRESQWAVRVKMRIAANDKLELRVEPVTVRYAHEGDEVETRHSHHSPDRKYAIQTVYEAAHELWNSLFIHRIEMISLPEMKVLAQLLPASEAGTRFGSVDVAAPVNLPLVWASDSKWCAFYFSYPDRGGHSSGHTTVFHEERGKFVATHKPRQLRAGVLRDPLEGQLSESVSPVRWIKPGTLFLEQTRHFVSDDGSEKELFWQLEAAYDEKRKSMRVVRVKKLSPEEAAKLDEERRDPATPQ
ncbi:MAG TPA: hypothetical protein VFG14_00540 [Chthoniobacteraceae bacterium]|nr:hypothetical protein [Chthoniobacteraceae bacterium]